MASKNHYISQFLISGNDIVNASVTFADLGTVYTDNVTEGTSLYFSNARVANAFVGTGTANALLYLNSSKVTTTNSNMTFDGNNLILGGSSGRRLWFVANGTSDTHYVKYDSTIIDGLAINGYSGLSFSTGSTTNGTWAEQMRLTSTGLTTQKDATIYGLTVGRGAGAVGTNTVVGSGALATSNTGPRQTAIGYRALSAYSGSVGYNTAIGSDALQNTTGSYDNVAVGDAALNGVSNGNGNVAVGNNAILFNQTGSSNTAVGHSALRGASLNSFSNNTAVGYQAAYSNTTGGGEVAIGHQALYSNTTGNQNTAVGQYSLYPNTTGALNSALGWNSLGSNTTGSNNTALGYNALANNTTASNNTAVGYQAGATNQTGQFITAIGERALYNSTADYNTAVGSLALYANTTGTQNVAVGGTNGAYSALRINTTGSYNTAVGNAALANNTTASNNTAVGYQAGYSNTTGEVTAFGYNAGRSNTTGVNLTAIGSSAAYNNTTGSGNTAVGMSALNTNSTGINNTMVGYLAGNALTTNNSTFIGNTAGYLITTGTNNTILGRYSGNQGGLDIRTASNYIVLSDGDGTPRFYVNNYGAASIGFTGSAGVGLNQATGTMLMVSDYNNGGFGCLSLGAPSGNYGSIGYGFAPTNTGFKYTNNDYSSRILFAASITTFTSVVGTAGTAITYTQGPYVANGGTSWTSSSDVRLKNVTGGITGALAKVQAMNPVWFSWKRDAANAQNLGFIAQELHQVLPEVVDVPTHETDPRSGEQNYWGVNYTEIVPLLTAAIQELKSELDLVKAELATLKGN